MKILASFWYFPSYFLNFFFLSSEVFLPPLHKLFGCSCNISAPYVSMVMQEATLMLFRVILSDMRYTETYTDRRSSVHRPGVNFIIADMFTQKGHVHVFSAQHKQGRRQMGRFLQPSLRFPSRSNNNPTPWAQSSPRPDQLFHTCNLCWFYGMITSN